MSKRRVVVTGLGMFTPLGLNVKDTWDGILSGKSGVAKITEMDVSEIPVRIGAGVPGFNPENYLPHKTIRKSDSFVHLGLSAAMQAVQDSGLEATEENGHRIGVAMGSGIGGLPAIERNYEVATTKGMRRVSPTFIPAVIINMLAGYISMEYGFRGPNYAVVTACTTGTHNIGLAARSIQSGDADAMIAGGAEMATSILGVAGFAAMRALSRRNDDPTAASRPWDRDRDGFVLGQGAGVLVLEEYEFAKKRGAKIYAELSGFGMSADAFHVTAPSVDGPTSCMTTAINDAGINKQQLDYINAHGTSTPIGDINEARSIKQTFGDHAYDLAVSSTKSMIGHLLGAAGAVEAIFSILALRDQVAPPTINLDNPDDECDLNFVAHEAQSRKINYSLSNSFGFGGTNGSLLFKKFDDN